MRRISLACGLVAVALGGCSDGAVTDTLAPPTATTIPVASTTGAPPAVTTPGNGQPATVLTVLDGDSLAVDIAGVRTEVRLAGVNAPEADECHGGTSRDMLSELVGGAEVLLVPVAGDDDIDQFGRLLRNVWSGDTWVNGALVRQGAAVAIQTGSSEETQLVDAENAAWIDRLGMWDPAACGEAAQGVAVTDANYDPPGADPDYAADEFVLIRNDGAEAVDVSGWIVRDESSQHRYRFPDGTVLAPGDGVRLRSGCGEDEGLDRYWCADDAVWSNGGDTVILQTATGTVVSRYKFGGSF